MPNFHVVKMTLTPGGYLPSDEDKRCGECDGYGQVDFGQFSSGEKCSECEGTGLVEPFKTRQIEAQGLKEEVDSLLKIIKDQVGDLSSDEISDLKTKIQMFKDSFDNDNVDSAVERAENALDFVEESYKD